MKAADHAASLGSNQDRAVTVGTVQARITKGMGGAEVAEILGSPNIVSKDSQGNDSWIYDKIATEASYSNDTGSGAGLIGGGGGSLILGGLLGSYERNDGASATTQRTLTVVIKFDSNQRVSAFSYHGSKF